MAKYFKQYTKKSGQTAWMINSLYLGKDETGEAVRVTRRGFVSLKEAKIEARKIQSEFDRGEYGKKVADNTFKEIYELWFDSYKKTVKEATQLGTARLMKNHILPKFGELKVTQITPKMAQKAVNDWADKLKSYKINLVYARKVMDFAITLELIAVNPFDKVIRPKAKNANDEVKINYYTTDQIKHALNTLEQRVKDFKFGDKGYYFALFEFSLYRLLAFSGLRVSEALALSWSDIDFSEQNVTVNKTLSRTKKGYKISSPKTKCSNRTISLDARTIHILKRWQFTEKELLFSNRVKDCTIIFADLNGEYLNYNDIYRRSERLAKRADLPSIGTHGWRHSYASMLFQAGVSPKEAQAALGHSSIEMTMNIYTHLGQEDKKQTADKLAKYANF